MYIVGIQMVYGGVHCIRSVCALTIQLDGRVRVVVIKSLLHTIASRKVVSHIGITLQEKVFQVEGIGCGALLVWKRPLKPLACSLMQFYFHLQ